MQRLATRFALAALLLGAALGARAANLSDLWWNPAKPGSGLQVVQQGETAFVTLFTYGSNGEPFWVVAPDAQVYAYLANGQPQLRGKLYRTRGSAFSAPYQEADGQVIEVGMLYLSPTDDNTLKVTYNVNNIDVELNLQRQTFRLVDVSAHYAGNFTLRLSHATGGQPYGTREYDADFLFTVNGDNIGLLRVEEAINGICEYRGPYVQTGRFGSFKGTYACQSGESGSFEVTRVELTDQGVTGNLVTTGRDGTGRGRFGAVRR